MVFVNEMKSNIKYMDKDKVIIKLNLVQKNYLQCKRVFSGIIVVVEDNS